MITLARKNEIIEELLYKEVLIHLETGKKVFIEKDPETNKDFMFYYDDENKKVPVALKTDVVKVVFDERVRKSMAKAISNLEKSRKIFRPFLVDENTPAVKRAIQSAKRMTSSVLNDEIKQMLINEARSMYSDQYEFMIYQVVSWALIRDSIFYFDENKQMLTDYEIDIPKEYWEEDESESKDDYDPLFDMVKTPSVKLRFKRDKTNPIEVQVAHVTYFLENEDHKNFTTVYSEIVAAVMNAIVLSTTDDLQVDDEGLFRSTVDELVPRILRGNNDDE